MTKPLHSLEYKNRAKLLLERAGEYTADLTDILAQLEEIRLLCLHGVLQEKVSVKDGVLVVKEKYPAVALQAILGKLTVYKELSRLAELETVDPMVSVLLQVGSLEAHLEAEGNKEHGGD